ncbi:MAG: SGNH/GDSL hydrolase family protein [bacterium]
MKTFRWTFRKRILYLLYLLVVVTVATEIGVRIWGYSAHYIYEPIYTEYPAAEAVPYIHRPNLENARARGRAVINTDALGLRSLETGGVVGPKTATEYRIGIVGDSITFGEGVENTADTYCARLEAQLNAVQDSVQVRVFNFGVSAYSIREMAATLEHRMLAVEPDLVVMALIPHDFDLTRTPAIDKYGYNYNHRRSGFVAKDSFLKRAVRKLHLAYLVRDLHAKSDQVPHASVEDSLLFELPAGFRYVRRFAEFALDHGVAYQIVLLPTVVPKEYGMVHQQLVAERLNFKDLSSLRDEFSAESYLASRFDRHPSAAVHARIAEELARHIQSCHLR